MTVESDRTTSTVYGNRAVMNTSTDWLYYALLACSVLLAFGSALSLPYGFTDDYSMLFHQQIGWGKGTIDWYIASGRPLLGYMNYYLLGSIDYIDDLVILRTLGLALLVVLGWMILRVLLQYRLPGHEASMLATAFVLSPSAAVFAGWAIASASLLAGILSVFAASMSNRVWSEYNGGSQRGSPMGMMLLNGSGAILAIIVSLMIYQPLAPVFLLVCFLGFVFGPAKNRCLKYIAYFLFVYLVAVALYYLLFKYALLPNLPAQGGYTEAVERGSLDLSPFKMIKMLMAETIPMIIGGWDYFNGGVTPSSFPSSFRLVGTSLIASLLILLGSWYIISGLGEELSVRAGGTITLLIIWIISLLPMLILADHYMPIRTLFFSYALIPVLTYVAFKKLTGQRVWPSWVAIGVIIFLTSQAAVSFWDGFVRIQNREYTLMRQAVLSSDQRPSELVFIRPKLRFAPDHRMPTAHEYYFLSTHADWVPKAMANLIWNQREGIRGGHQEQERLHHTHVYRVRAGESNPAPGARIVDAQAILCGVPGELKSPGK